MDEGPTSITEPGKYWLYAMEVIEGERPTGNEHRTRDEYFEEHGVTRPQDLTVADLPPAETDAVRDLDRAALDEEKTGGKWHVAGSAEHVDQFWPDVVADVAEQVLWGAKAMTATGWDAHPGDNYMLLVYTPNYVAKHDVDRVRDHLCESYGLT